MNKFYIIITVLIFVLSGAVLFSSVHGLVGKPTETELNSAKWKENGPFELSPERGRFALTYNLIENKSFYFSLPLARFITPDLGYTNGHYVSLFAPLVSFITIPFYIVGSIFGSAEFGSFLTNAFFALINGALIYIISKKIGANRYSALLGSLIFMFATPAYAYSTTLYEHHISVAFILTAILCLINWDGVLSLAIIWLLCGLSIPVDYPNLFLMAPIGLAALGKMINISHSKNSLNISFKTVKILSLTALIIPIAFFLWFNYKSYGNPLQFSGTIQSVESIGPDGNPQHPSFTVNPNSTSDFGEEKQSALEWFKSRRLLGGFYVHLFSTERGVIVYTPIILIGIYGFWLLYKAGGKDIANVLLSIVSVDLLFYSMWGDPWGGWAFGSRYLIPAYSLLGILSTLVLTKFRKNFIFNLFITILIGYSVAINTLGSLTTNSVPPKSAAEALSKISGKNERYSFDRNWQYLNESGSKSYIYNAFVSNKLNAVRYYYILTSVIFSMVIVLMILQYFNEYEKE